MRDMHDDELLLMIPGPTNVPARVCEAISARCVYHRGPEFAALLAECVAGLQQVFGTSEPVAILSASGTGGVEAAIANLVDRGQHMLAINTGKFGKRMGDIAASYGVDVTWWHCNPGETADPRLLHRFLQESRFDALSFVYSETSTGVQQDLESLGHIAADAGVMTIVDAVSIIGGAPIDMDANRLDAVVGGSQKALMLPPGLSLVALSSAARERAARSNNSRYYFDLTRALKSLEKGQTPYTPAVNLFCGLREALRIMAEEGMPAIYQRHCSLARACRAAIASMGLQLLPTNERHASATVTAVHMPEGLDSSELVRRVREGSNILISGGQDELKGKIFRIGHLGSCSIDDLVETVQAVAESLAAMGLAVDAAGAASVTRCTYEELTRPADPASGSTSASPGER